MPKITLLDEVNCQITGLKPRTFNRLTEKMKIPVKGAYMQYSFQLGEWDGKESLIDEDGITFVYYLDEIAEHLDNMGVDASTFEIIDERECKFPELPVEPVKDDYLIEETGYILHEHQLSCLNNIILGQKGILDAATNAGKSVVAIGVAKYYQDYLPTITIVPNEKLLNQIGKDFEKAGFDYVKLNSKIASNAKRVQLIREHRHVVVTSKLLTNILTYEDESGDTAITGTPYVFINDETHIFGDTMYFAMRGQMYNAPIRIGLTGTVPKDKLKRAKLLGCLGGGTLDIVTAKYLMDNGFASQTDIKLWVTSHHEIEELCTADDVKKGRWDWDKDFKYYANEQRVEAIADFIKSFDDDINTLILCHPELGNKLAERLDLPFIDKDTKIEQRDELFSKFNKEDGVIVAASFGTSATGISENRIFRGFIIDVGKDETTIKQGIGRYMRLDGEINQVELHDISTNTYYGKKHRKDRCKIYKREGHPHTIMKDKLNV